MSCFISLDNQETDVKPTVSSVLVMNLKTRFRKGEWDKVEIEEGFVLNVAGGLIIEHPLILPYVKQVVGFLMSA
ncbi:unnamed protein product [Camellia sinensis]